MMSECCVQQRDDAVAPLIHDLMQSQELAEFRLLEAKKRFRDMSGGTRGPTNRAARPPHFELEANVELAEVMEERQNRQSGSSGLGEGPSRGLDESGS